MKSLKHAYQIYKYNEPINKIRSQQIENNYNKTQIGYKNNKNQRTLPTLYNFIEYQLKKH